MILYLDSSSGVKFYLIQARVVEEGAEAVQAHVEEADVVATSLLSYVEILSALTRARRGENPPRIRQEEHYEAAVRAFQRDWPGYVKMAASSRLVRAAGALAQRHVLRGYDAVQLASALELKRNVPTDFRFSCYDEDLKTAAEAEGLPTV